MAVKTGLGETFSAGDIVQLKSGGPPMTVERSDVKPWNGEPVVYCAWFQNGSNDPHVLRRDTFHPSLLSLISAIDPRAAVENK